MAVSGGSTTGSPSSANLKKYPKGNWKISALTGGRCVFSCNGEDWFDLSDDNSPVVLYSTALFVDTSTDGQVDLLPPQILPRYTREAEGKSQNKDEKKVNEYAKNYDPNEFIKDII